ncbi:ROK family protein [Prolixibacteraceae bacterium JC049]|nr:ROK family protein [Prolixibacteraceae bacterium JC049]
MKQVAIGIDIGGTNTVFGVVDQEGHVMVKNSIPTPKHGDKRQYADDLAEAINEVIDSVKQLNPEIEILGIGIGAPNGNYYTGSIEFAPNLAFQGVVPLVKMMTEKFPNLPAIALTNDANAAALGEMIYGGAKGMKNFVMMTLGTGVGSGIVVNGDLVYGHDGFAGEIGHYTVEPNGRACGCGQKGHLETYCSAPGMKRTAFELLAKYNASDSLLADKTFNELESKDIYEAAMKGDKVALEVFDYTGHILGRSMADVVSYFSPEAIFLFGGPTAAGDLIFEPTKKYMEQYNLPIFKDKVNIVPSELKMGDAPIVGSSALVWKELEK